MADEEEVSEFVDKSFWLPFKAVHDYAMVAIDKKMKQWNNRSIVPSKYDKSPLDRLYQDELGEDGHPILEQIHHGAGLYFKALLDCSQGRLIDAKHGDMVASTISPQLKVAAIYHQLSERRKYFVNRILIGSIRESDYPWMRQCKWTLQDAFDGLAEAIKKDNIAVAIIEIQKKNIDKDKNADKIIDNSRSTVAPIFTPPNLS